MSDKTRTTKYQDIPFIVDGVAKIVKSVTSQTTCSDVINKLPKLSTPLAVFTSVDGIEKELSSKSKLMKVWRAHSASQKVVFVVRRSETSADKLRGNKSRLFGDSKRCDQHSMISYQDRTKDRLKQFSSFIKEKRQRINRRFSEGPSFLHSTLKPKRTSSNMALESTRLSAALDKSTASTYHPKMTSSRKSTTNLLNIKPTKDALAMIDALGTKKLALKSTFKPVTKTTTERTSTGTLKSSDTGYSSTSASTDIAKPVKNQTKLLADSEDGPRHSTPVTQHTRKRRSCELQTTLDELDELQGKSVILRKFMEDQKIYGASNNSDDIPVPEIHEIKRRCTEDNRFSLPAFATQEEKCRYLWNQYCDSESECSEDSFMNNSAMDIAFVESFDLDMETIFTKQRKSKLRRESAISNLTKYSLHRKEADIVEEAEASYDYSFDCSFQRMDESQAAEFGTEFHEQFNHSDVSVDSFMKTRYDVYGCDDVTNGNKKADTCSESDEGIGSSASGSVNNVRVSAM